MISVDEAISHIVQNRLHTEAENRTLTECDGLILAADLIAKITHPPRDVSAMDGYAVRYEDVETVGQSVEIIGEAPAGHEFGGKVGPGQAVRIFTGGIIPEGANHVLIQEDGARADDRVQVVCNQAAPKHIRKAGRDFSKGEVLVKAGARIGAAEIALAAASDNDRLTVRRPLKVAVLCNGDELRLPGDDRVKGQIVSSNGYALSALLRSWGCEPLDLGIATDSVEAIKRSVLRANAADIIVPIGGASVGDHDHMKRAFAELGLEIIFSKIAVRPGKPTWFGRMGRQLVLGLPGNPASAYVCAQLFLKMLCSTAESIELKQVTLCGELAPNGPRETYLRGVLRKDGKVEAMPDQDSSLLKPILRSNCLIQRLRHAPTAREGDTLKVLPI